MRVKDFRQGRRDGRPLGPEASHRNDHFMETTSVAATDIPDDATLPASAAVEVRETHTGVVVLIGDRAYKTKKPVVTDFLDFSTPAKREEGCVREVSLNSRIAPESYLGVGHFIDPSGGAPEPVIVMRRYSDAYRLASMVRRGEPVQDHLDAIAVTVARFHAGADRSRTIDASAKVAEIRDRWTENLTELRRFVRSADAVECVEDVQRLAEQFIDGRSVLFGERIASRRIVDGHGDLLADDIFCLPDGPVLLDCLEFDDELRYVDCIDDIGFLAMDLAYLDRADLSEHLLETYVHLTDDPAPLGLRNFYLAYRAVVRAKVDYIRASQGQQQSRVNALRHLALARDYLRAGTVRLILVGGGPGTGKTTLARALAERIHAEVISTDDVRLERRRADEMEGAAATYNEGRYSPDKVDDVYAVMLHRAALLLAEGRTVILDGTWRDAQHRQLARTMASREHCPTVEFECTLPLEEAQARILARRATTSEATPQIAAAIAHEPHDWGSAHPIDTSVLLGDSVTEAQQICCLAI